MNTAIFGYIAVAAGLWAGLLALAVLGRAARSSHAGTSPGALNTLLKLWGWLAIVVTVAGAGNAFAGPKGFAVAMLALLFTSVAVFAGHVDARRRGH